MKSLVFLGLLFYIPAPFLALRPSHLSSSVWVHVSAAVLGWRLWGSHSAVTHGLMWDGNILNLSYPSGQGTCGFQKSDGTGSLKRGKGSERKVSKG